MATNPFFVQPAEYGQGLAGLGQSLSAFGEQRKMQQQQEEQQVKAQEAKAAMQSAFASGNPDEIANVMMQYPEMGQTLQQAIGFRDNQTKDNFVQSAREVVLNPNKTEETLKQRIQMVTDKGGDPTQSIAALEEFKANPNKFMQSAKNVFAAYDPTGFKSYQGAQPQAQQGPPTANVKDYEYYLQLKQSNPEEAEAFGRQIGLAAVDPEIKQTTAMRNFEKYVALPEGGEKEAFAKIIGLSPKESAKDQIAKAEKVAKTEAAVASLDSTIELADGLLSQEGFDDYFGFSSIVPAIPGSAKADFEVALNSFINNLTLENLGKMSGVLTDKDIAVLQSSAAAIDSGMSEKAAKKEIGKIIGRLKSRRAGEAGKLGKMSKSSAPETVQVPIAEMSDEELAKSLGL